VGVPLYLKKPKKVNCRRPSGAQEGKKAALDEGQDYARQRTSPMKDTDGSAGHERDNTKGSPSAEPAEDKLRSRGKLILQKGGRKTFGR